MGGRGPPGPPLEPPLAKVGYPYSILLTLIRSCLY